MTSDKPPPTPPTLPTLAELATLRAYWVDAAHRAEGLGLGSIDITSQMKILTAAELGVRLVAKKDDTHVVDCEGRVYLSLRAALEQVRREMGEAGR